MQSDEWPVEIGGKKYAVDQTLGGFPGVYKAVADGCYEHIDGSSPLTVGNITEGVNPGDDHVIIIARLME